MKFAPAPFARAALLALAAALTLASNAPPDPPAQYPYGQQPGPYTQQPDQPYGQPQPGQDPYGQPQPQPAPGDNGLGALQGGELGAQVGGQPAAPGVPGQDYCFTLRTAQTTTSICAVGFGGCERQRQGAVADGQSTTECVPWSPVACFQLGGDASLGSRFCAANLEDCELWRRVDRQNNGATGDACAWKQ